MAVMGTLCKLEVLGFSYNSELGDRYENHRNRITYNLWRMDLSQNNIRGTLLHLLEELRNLGHLSLEENKFFGQVPSLIGNSPML